MKEMLQELYRYENGRAVFKLNSEIYSKEVILQAAYVLLDDMYILLDKKENYFYIYVKPKKELNADKIAHRIMDELIEANAYLKQAERTKEIRQTLLEKALLSNSVDADDIIQEENKMFGDLSSEEFYKEDEK